MIIFNSVKAGSKFLIKLSVLLISYDFSVNFAVAAPDAGSLQQQINREQQVAPAKLLSSPESTAPVVAAKSPKGIQITVTQFKFVGNTLLASDVLAAQLGSYLNRPIDFAALQEAADALAAFYRESGWVVQTLVPEQDFVNGMVTLQIIEAKFGAVVPEGNLPGLVDMPLILDIFRTQLREGDPLNGDALDRALLLADDLPGVAVSGRMQPGKKQGETDVLLKMADEPEFSGDSTTDNTGSRSTGVNRVLANLNLNSPLGRGDLFTINTIFTVGSDYERVGGTFPLGSNGLRVGASASHLYYHLITSEYATTNVFGTSNVCGVEASYPIFRSRKQNLNLALNLDEKRFDNQSAGVTVSRYKVVPLSIALSGNLFDQFGGGGANSASLTVIQGHLYDRASSATPDGSYSKFKYTFSRQQVLTEDLSLFGSVSGQKASRNLDSSENFGLGGNSGVRAYPTSEGSGNEGWMMNLEVRLHLPEGFNLTGFYDHGQISLAKSPTGTGINDYVLQGAGLTLLWQSGSYPTLKMTWAHRIGDNPNQTSTGFDQDGSLTKNRFWLSASIPF